MNQAYGQLHDFGAPGFLALPVANPPPVGMLTGPAGAVQSARGFNNVYPDFRLGMGADARGTHPGWLAPGNSFSGYGAFPNYSGSYGKKDPTTQCSKWQQELAEAKAGIGKGLFGFFKGGGLFGGRVNKLEKKVTKWCGRAESQAEAAEQAAAFAASLTPTVPIYGPEGQPTTMAGGGNTLVYVGLGLAAVGVIGAVVLMTGKKRKKK